MAPPKDIARSYPKRGLTADVGFRSEPKFCGDGSIQLNGSNQYLNAELSSALGDSFTIMAWVKRLAGSTYQYIFDTGNSTVSGGEISLAIATSNRLYFYDGSGSITATTFNTDLATWYHVAIAVAPGSGSLKIYADGVDVTPTNSANINITDPTFEIGRHIGVANYLYGHVSDVRIYDETLTQDQIRELLNNPGQTVPTGLTSADLIHRYLLETDTNDSGATGNNLTANNSPTFGVDRAQLPRGLDLARGAAMARVYTGRAVDFDGSTDFLDMGTGVDKNYTTRSDRASFSVWFNTDQTSIPAFIYQNRTQIVTDRPECETHLFITTAQGLTFDGEGAAVLIPITNLTIGKWHHFVGIADDTDGPIKAYLDGVLYDTISPPQAGANGSEFVIGARNNSPIQVFNGQLSNFKIFNVELTQDQVRELYHNPEMVIPAGVSASNLRRHYPLCAYNDTGGMGGRYETDQGVEGVNGEYGGSPVMAFAQPVPCPQLGLQQSATRVYFERNSTRAQATLGSAPGTACTMSAWVMVDESFPYQYFMKNGTNITANAFFAFAVDNNRRLYAVQSSSILAQGSLSLSDYGEWNHVVAMTKSTAPYVRFFINGVEDTSITDSGMVAFDLTSTFVEIGSDGGANHLKGFLNDCAIWDVELSDSEVASLYNSGIQGMDVSTVQSSNLKGWWKCDDLTRFKDYSGNGINATLTASVNAASFPENASGSTIVGDFSMKRKGVSVLNPTFDPIATSSVVGVSAEIPGCDAISFDPAKGMSFTLAFRLQSFKPTPTSVWYPRIFAANAAGSDYYLRFNYTHQILNFVFRDSASTTQSYDYTTGTVSDLDWHHIAITLDTSTSPNTTVKLWFDGALINTFSSNNHNYAFTPDELRIGTYNFGNGNFPGAIANFRIYQAALSQGEVEQSYSSDMRLIKGLANE